MGEFGYMEDAENSVESDVFSQYLHSFGNATSQSEKIEKLAKQFNLSKEKIASIVNSDESQKETKFTNLDYLKTLSTKELDGIYAVLSRQGKIDKNAEYMTNIEKISIERKQTNE